MTSVQDKIPSLDSKVMCMDCGCGSSHILHHWELEFSEVYPNWRTLPAILKIVSASAAMPPYGLKVFPGNHATILDPKQFLLKKDPSYQLCWGHPENSQGEAKLEQAFNFWTCCQGGLNRTFLYDQSFLAFIKGPTYPEMQILGRKKERTKGSTVEWWLQPQWMLWLEGEGERVLRKPHPLTGQLGRRSP